VHLVPESAIVEESPQRRTFGEMRQAMVLKSHPKTSRRFGDDPLNEISRDVSIGCGFSDVEPSKDEVVSPARTRRRRLQHVENAGACNNSTNFYCWMSCLDIPSHDKAPAFLKEGYSLYCVDPSIVASSGSISSAQEPCIERGVVGLAMNTNCMGMWQPSAPGVVGQEVTLEDGMLEDLDEPFCYGGTSMYMDGFHWLGSTCPIYLFPSFVLDSAGALVGACFFTIFFGIALEWIIQRRRVSVRKFPPGYKRLAASASFYCIQLTMGYTIMLVVMVYSITLFLSVVCGIVSGHVLFSASDALFTTKSAAASAGCETLNDKWSDDPEEMEGREQTLTTSGRNLSGLGTTAFSRTGKKGSTSIPSAEFCVPEGSTPCCQNEL
jgi:Ctr copper transporter family